MRVLKGTPPPPQQPPKLPGTCPLSLRAPLGSGLGKASGFSLPVGGPWASQAPGGTAEVMARCTPANRHQCTNTSHFYPHELNFHQ